MSLDQFKEQIAEKEIVPVIKEFISRVPEIIDAEIKTARYYAEKLLNWAEYTKAQTFRELQEALPISADFALSQIYPAHQRGYRL